MAPTVCTQTTSFVSCFNGKQVQKVQKKTKKPDEERSEMNPFEQGFLFFFEILTSFPMVEY